MTTNFASMMAVLVDGRIDFAIIGGVAATAHGVARATYDLDICYSRETANLERLAHALKPLHPSLRGAPEGLPFLWDAETIRRGLNFTLMTDLGPLDLLGDVAGVGGYDKIKAGSSMEMVFGQSCAVISLTELIVAKRAAGRAKDGEALIELEALWEAQQDD